ncbi:MAG: subclass B3 metallo-beta-lactamase [Woeseiaceae bacterium]|nr:subclass B3 metallo-beta-lactamase [Woeseiaceae bacterium]
MIAPRSATKVARLFLPQLVATALAAGLAGPAAAEFQPESPAGDDPQRTEPVAGFRVIDNVYFVGARLHLPSWLIETSDGLILIDTTFDEYVPGIVENIEALGFSIDDVKLLLSSHAHHDHVGGHATMREITGATLVAMAEDRDVIESGGATDFRDRGTWAPAVVDRVIADGDEIRLGDTVLTAHLTPGHTKGCTTWTMVVEDGGRSYDLVILGGVRVNDREPLVGHPDYPEMPRDFAWTFARLKVLPVDVYLGAHGYWFDLPAKRARLADGAGPNPFIDPDGYRDAVAYWENQYLERLREETHGSSD